MPERSDPSFVDVVAYLDSYWHEMVNQNVAVVEFEDAIMQNTEFRQSVDVRDEIDRQRTARLALVLLYHSFSDQVACDLLRHCLGAAVMGALTALNTAIEHHNPRNPMAHRGLKTPVAFSVSKYALTELTSFTDEEEIQHSQQAIQDITQRLGVSDDVVHMLREAQSRDVESYLSGEVN